VQIGCTDIKLLCAEFVESLLLNIDLCQLEVFARTSSIGWCHEEIRDECLIVILLEPKLM
jgi:hypothetical protein